MTKVTFVLAALIVAAVFTTQARLLATMSRRGTPRLSPLWAGAVNSPAWHEAVLDVGRTH
jgi:hypothetical protein